MKRLVVYYSRTGTTKEIGEEIAEALEADSEGIIDKKSREGMIGWLKAGWDAWRGKNTEIEVKKNPEGYDIVVIGTPIWGGNMTPAVRTYLTTYDLTGKKTAFFTTQKGDDPVEAIAEMKEIVGKSGVIGSLSLQEDKVQADQYQAQLRVFTEDLEQRMKDKTNKRSKD